MLKFLLRPGLDFSYISYSFHVYLHIYIYIFSCISYISCIFTSVIFPGTFWQTNVQKILQSGVLGLLAHVTPLIFFSRILRSEALVYNSFLFFRTTVLRKLFDIRFLYDKHCNFSRSWWLTRQDGFQNRDKVYSY